jgi:hypothetical protein
MLKLDSGGIISGVKVMRRKLKNEKTDVCLALRYKGKNCSEWTKYLGKPRAA